MRTVIAITLGVAFLSLPVFPRGLILQLPLLDHTGAPLTDRPVEVAADGPEGREVIRTSSGPDGVLVEALHLSWVWGLTVSAAGYLPVQVTELRTIEAKGDGRTQVYLVPAVPVRLTPLLPAGLPWSPSRRLSWADFRGSPPQAPGEEGARIHLRVSYQVALEVRKGEEGFRAVIPQAGVFTACIMDPYRSWVRPGAELPGLLAHEQGHFDLAEVYRRLLAASLPGLSELRPTQEEAKVSLEGKAAAIAQGILARMEAAQALYDRETEHGLDGAAQARWLGLIQAWLDDPYRSP